MKIYVLVVCAKGANGGEYDLLANTIKATWGRDETDDIKVFYLWCNNYKYPDEKNYVLNKEEGYGMLLWKTLGFLFKHRHDDFDYVFRVNVGSYVHLERLYKHLLNCPREMFYSGAMGQYKETWFVSGTGFLMSRDLVMLSLRKIKKFGFDYIDDVSCGRFFQRNNIPITPDFSRVVYEGEISGFENEKTYHWKLRNGDGQRIKDCQNMVSLYNKFKK
jgi:hypothetical protein